MLNEEQTLELIKCMEDLDYFIKTYSDKYIVDYKCIKDNVLLYDSNYNEHSVYILLHKLLFDKNKTILIITNKTIEGEEILRKLYESYYSLPDYFIEQCKLIETKKRSIRTLNRVSIILQKPNSILGRGLLLDTILIRYDVDMNNLCIGNVNNTKSLICYYKE